jgi:hypothetical protein
VALTTNTARVPGAIVRGLGCEVMVGGTIRTVRLATSLVAEFTEFVIIT